MTTPTRQFYRGIPRPAMALHQGLDGAMDDLRGWLKRRAAGGATLARMAAGAHAIGSDLAPLPPAELRARIAALRARFLRGQDGRDDLLLGLGLVAAAARAALGMEPYPEQLMGAVAIREGLFAEMATGEGKTLTIALAAAVIAWRRQPLHVITANDYLAGRDAEALAPLYDLAGVRVAAVTGEMDAGRRADAYQADVVYTTSKELLADFLRDRLQAGGDAPPTHLLMRRIAGREGRAGRILRGIHTAIVDEGDSVLIDDAVTPLIIAQPVGGDEFGECCRLARDFARHLREGRDYRVDRRHSEIRFLPPIAGALAAAAARFPPLWRSLERREEIVRLALTAELFFHRDRHYIVRDHKVEIVDESTGRILPGRSWKRGLHQAIEAKEGLPVTDPTHTLASMSFQRFFRTFTHLAALSGTATESAGELWRIYRLPVVRIPTHRPVRRTMLPPLAYAGADEKLAAIVEEIERLHLGGRAVLAGTRTIETSHDLSALLAARGVPHRVLNALHTREEAQIVARAGDPGAVTIATNMAGRGTDIAVPEKVLELGGLHVIVVERNLSPRVDRQLVGRSARQGDPGSARIYVSVEDELLRKFLPARVGRRLRAAFSLGLPARARLVVGATGRAQAIAQRLASAQRRSVLKLDTWIEEDLGFVDPDSRA